MSLSLFVLRVGGPESGRIPQPSTLLSLFSDSPHLKDTRDPHKNRGVKYSLFLVLLLTIPYKYNALPTASTLTVFSTPEMIAALSDSDPS